MRDIRFLLKTHYAESHALIIGINQYQHVSPLSYAVNDAREIRDLLVTDFDFPSANVVYLTDAAATRAAILKAFSRFMATDVDLDDKIFIFFAGHGKTLTGIRGEVGFLVPYDGDPSDYSTFIRWDELTHGSELIRAKHLLFIMDACYGGLALTRDIQPGSTRFLKDMMLRYSRQVLTAGKADEVVADAGGPIPNHSIFTGHLIQALRGKASAEGGIITANGVMAYVYSKVANDRNSNQTPHYGHFDGDGDFIFKAPGLNKLEQAENKDLDELISVPYPEEPLVGDVTESKVARVKALLSTENAAIELHDFLTYEVRRFLSATSEDSYAVSRQYSPEEFISRLSRYEEASGALSVLLACVAHWAKPAHMATLQKSLARSCDRLERSNGSMIWLSLRWYPILLEFYCAGIAAIDAQRFDSLATVFYTPIPSNEYRGRENMLVEAIWLGLQDLEGDNVLNQIPGHERNHAPLSEYLFKILQPKLDDALFLGKNYENAFDTFEVFFALAFADIQRMQNLGVWGPIGRFGWKFYRGAISPLARVISEATRMKEEWPPLRAGLFGGSYERFDSVASEYADRIGKLGWL
jgi:hypothetical protein